MSDDKDQLIEGHEYDGIQEFDNPLPMWWLVTFFATIIFSFNYWIHYEFGGGQTQKQELAADMERIKAVAPKPGGASPDKEEDLAKLAGNAEVLKLGKDTFAAKCAACHGAELQGVIGPDLVDDYWIHGEGKLSDIAAIIRSGVPDKGMPTWEGQLKDEEIRALAVFIVSNQGSNPPNAKPPQGEPVVRN